MREHRGELIGQGGQYKVYEAGQDRVLKVPNSPEEAAAVHSKWASTPEEAVSSAKQGLSFRDNNVPRILRMACRYDNLASLLGNPKAEPQGCFTQDRVRMLGDLMDGSNRGKIVEYLKKYVDCIHDCWRFGLHDYMHLFDCNYGMATSGDVVFIDFGEVSGYTPFVRDLIENEGWSERFEHFAFLKTLVTEDLHEKYRQIMRASLSVEIFQTTWGTGLDDLDRELVNPPALRDRPEEIPELSRRLIERSCRESGRELCALSETAIDRLRSHPWGPPTDLEIVIVDAVQRCQSNRIEDHDIDLP